MTHLSDIKHLDTASEAQPRSFLCSSTSLVKITLVALLDFPNVLDSNGSNYDSETSHSVGVLTYCIHRSQLLLLM